MKSQGQTPSPSEDLGVGAFTTSPLGAAAMPVPVDGVTRVEVKCNVRRQDIDDALDRFDLVPDNADTGRVYFFDTAEFDLYKSDRILRARKKVGVDGDDTTAKLRPVRPELIARRFRDNEEFKCELEIGLLDNRSSVSASIDEEHLERDLERNLQRGAPRRLFTPLQRSFVELEGNIPWDELQVIGPITSRVWKVQEPRMQGSLTLELWQVAPGQEFLEISTKCEPGDEAAARTALRQVLDEKGIAPSRNPDSKTRQALVAVTGRDPVA